MHESAGDWNLYVKGTLAFLDKDRLRLEQYRHQLVTLAVPDGFTYIDDKGERPYRHTRVVAGKSPYP